VLKAAFERHAAGTPLAVVALGLLAAPLLAEAQQSGKVHRIGYIRSGSGPLAKSPAYTGLRKGLGELGYVEGQNLVIEHRSAKRKRERYPVIATELVRLKVDVIVTSPGPPGIRAAQQATRTIPIVISGVRIDPVEAGFVLFEVDFTNKLEVWKVFELSQGKSSSRESLRCSSL